MQWEPTGLGHRSVIEISDAFPWFFADFAGPGYVVWQGQVTVDTQEGSGCRHFAHLDQ